MNNNSENNKNNNKLFNEFFANPIHGIHGREKQIEEIILNNIILYDYFNNIWENFRSFFNK